MKLFDQYFEKKFPRSTKDMSHSTIFDCGFGKMIPTDFEELTPNDKIIHQCSNFIQPVGLFAPVFSKIRVRSRTFAVPFHTLVGYDYLEKFYDDTKGEVLEPYTTLYDLAMTSYKDPWNDEVTVPVLQDNTLVDFMNIPTFEYRSVGAICSAIISDPDSPLAKFRISLMKPLAYLKIYNDWYRDENYDYDWNWFLNSFTNRAFSSPIMPSQEFPYIPCTANIMDEEGKLHNVLEVLFTPRFANVGRDYFMGVLPSQQAGDPVRLPLGDEADVFWKSADSDPLSLGAETMKAKSLQQNMFETDEFTDISGNAARRLVAKLGSTAVLDVVQFRTLEAAQSYAERNARGGHRLPEILRSRYNSHVPDAFIPRSIYVGGSVEDVKIDTIFSTAATDRANIGDYTGRGYAAGQSKYTYFKSVLPSMVVTIQTILPVPSYYQGVSKTNTRLSIFDKVIPEFAHVGEQPVMSSEFMINPAFPSGFNPDSIFGYVPRYADWMIHPDEIHGSFRSSLSFWHTSPLLPFMDDNNDPVQNLELTPQLLTLNWYKDCYRIFTFTPEHEIEAVPFRCVNYFKSYKTTCLPKHPKSY